VQYLDFVLSEKGVAASPEKVKAVHNFPTPKCVKENTSQDRRLENLKAKASLRMAYKAVAKAKKKAHRNNKRFYVRKAKTRHFEVNNTVFVHHCYESWSDKKSHKFWSGPYKIIRKISELNYDIVGQDDKKSIVHVNRLKNATIRVFGNPDKIKISEEAPETES